MHPALSLVMFTTLSGAGFGMMIWTGLGAGPDGSDFALPAGLVAGALAISGFGASALHLKRPDRAWRAFSQWRSSWLSREAVLGAASCTFFGLYWLGWVGLGIRMPLLGLLAAGLSLATVFATAMIYAQLRSVPKWSTPLTPITYLSFSIASGTIAVASLAALSGELPLWMPAAALAALAVAWIAKLAWWRRDGSRSRIGASLGAATGLAQLGRVRQFEAPHTGRNYLMKEMAFTVARSRSRALRRLAVTFGAVVPAALLMLSLVTGPAAALVSLAALSHIAGLFAERWLFFAEAQHVVSAYYDLPEAA